MDDISTGAKIGIGLVVLCFLVTITLSLLMIVKNITNSGVSTLQNGLDQMMQTQFDDYDQQIKTGTEVTSAIKLFEGQPIAVVVITSACQNGVTGAPAGGYNYGAILKDFQGPGSDPTSPQYTKTTAWDATAKGASSFWTMDYNKSSGNIIYNYNIKPAGVTGDSAFIRSSGRFMAELIKDSTGTTVGIMFTQQS